jgi:transcriptional regulator with XRE-family HTH domain
MYSQSELETRAHTSQSWIGRVETGSEISSLGGMARIAGAVRIEAAELPCEHAGWDY